MFVALAVIFVVAPLVEIYVMVQVAQSIGVLEMLIVLVLLCCTGAWVLKVETFESMRKVRASVREGRMPTAEVLDALLVFTAGILLLLPGFVSDAMGLLLVFPPVRSVARRMLQRSVESGVERRVRITGLGTSGAAPGGASSSWSARSGPRRNAGKGPAGDPTGPSGSGRIDADDVIDLDGEEVWFVDVKGEIEAAKPESPE